MTGVATLDTVLEAIKKTKDSQKGFLTNLFLDIPKTELWIKLNLLDYEEIGETIFICKKNSGFRNLFFLTTHLTSLKKDINNFLKKYANELFVIDVVGFGNNVSDIKGILVEEGFYNYTSLVRMSKVSLDNYAENISNPLLNYADKEKGIEVHNLLQTYFDPYAEQLPLIEEIYNWTDKNGIVVYSEIKETIQGFLIFDLIGQTSYLRYWFVHPDHREKKIGSTLLRNFFAESKDTKRQIFWVIDSNVNAIKRYEHYGFKKEPLFDCIMINKNICYEG